MTEKELDIIKGFIDKQEPKMEFEEVKAITKLLFWIYGRLANDTRTD